MKWVIGRKEYWPLLATMVVIAYGVFATGVSHPTVRIERPHPPLDLHGTWKSTRLELHEPSPEAFPQCERIELAVHHITPSEQEVLIHSRPANHALIAGLKNGYELTLRAFLQGEEVAIPDAEPGWIETSDKGDFLCFGPAGSHFRFRLDLKDGQLRLRGKALDADLTRIGQAAME